MLQKLFALPLLCLFFAALPACGGSAAAVPTGGMGLVVVPADPAQRGIAPEELEARGVRSYFHDFGRVRLGETVQHVFQVENTDPRPVTITRMQASCGCTTPTIRYADKAGQEVRGRTAGRAGPVITIPPGTVADLAFRIDTNDSEKLSHNTDKLYTVQVATDSPNRGYLRLEAHIVIERAFQATPQPLELGRIPRGGGATGKVGIIAVGTVDAKLVRVGELPPGVRAELIAEPLNGMTTWNVEITLEPPLEPGPVLRRFDLMTEDAEGLPYYPFPLEVRAFVVEDVDWSPQRFLMRNAATAEKPLEAAVEIYSLLSGERLKVTGARLEGQGTQALEIAFEPNEADANGRSEKWTLTLRTRQPFGDEVVRGKAVVELDGREPAEIELLVNPR